MTTQLTQTEIIYTHDEVSSTDPEIRWVKEQDYDSLRAQLAAAQRERDLAIAHDRQPYPTADAYEKVCAALAAAQRERDEAREKLRTEMLKRPGATSTY